MFDKFIRTGDTLSMNTQLATLTGSEKQISWATDLRAEFMRVVSSNTIDTTMENDEFTLPLAFKMIALSVAAEQVLETETNAKTFIDNRTNLLKCLPRAIYLELFC